MFNTPIVTTTENVTNIMVKRRYLPEKEQKKKCVLMCSQASPPFFSPLLLFLPSSGTDMDVDGMISANNKKKTVSDSRMEMDRDTCSENGKRRKRCREHENYGQLYGDFDASHRIASRRTQEKENKGPFMVTLMDASHRLPPHQN